MWAAADDMVDNYIKLLCASPMTTSDLAMLLLAMENDHVKLNLAVIGATALQRLAAQS
jgi:hypothetical protein